MKTAEGGLTHSEGLYTISVLSEKEWQNHIPSSFTYKLDNLLEEKHRRGILQETETKNFKKEVEISRKAISRNQMGLIP